MKAANLLVEIGTEELPPKALRSLMDAFAELLGRGLDDARLGRGDLHAFASPRRLAVIVDELQPAQADRSTRQMGPPTRIAFDGEGQPKPAAVAFAGKCGVDVSELEKTQTDKGEYLSYEVFEPGLPVSDLIAGIIDRALAALPIPRRMRWGAGDAEFVRPVHWVVLLHGKTVVEARVMGIAAGALTQGHRFHSSGDIRIASADDYPDVLEKEGRVIVDFDRRRELVRKGVVAAAKTVKGTIVDGEGLYDEVAALVEWPVPLLGNFDDAFLKLPREVVVSTLTGHQRYFPVADSDGNLKSNFVTVANLESLDPDQVREGNERVIRPRLADAAFFWDSDRKRSLDARREALHDVVYQRGLGSLADKSKRVAVLAASIAGALGADQEAASRAAELCKCDLLTGMVGEFPELQGTMGRYYAIEDGEPAAVSAAIGEHYLPRFAGDELPQSIAGQVLGLADKLDTLAGVFALGKVPSGNRDPFGLRRAALGVVRILVECRLDLDLAAAIAEAAALQPAGKIPAGQAAADLSRFIADRLKGYFLDRDTALTAETFEAVMARAPASLVDFDQRLHAVQAFLGLEEAESLAAANKRIGNILKKAELDETGSVNRKLLTEANEISLFEALSAAAATVRPMVEKRQYTEALAALASLRGPVDKFFDGVMVMAEDERVRDNRLALLSELRDLFLEIADISRLAIP